MKEIDFYEKLKHLKEYKDQYGDTMVPYDFHSPDGFWLGSWVKVQRELYQTGRLSEERISSIDRLGFVWYVDHFTAQRKGSDEKFEIFFAHLMEYKKKYGHCDVQQKYVSPDGYRLGAVVNKKRIRPERMTDEQRERLSLTGFKMKSENKLPCNRENRRLKWEPTSESDKRHFADLLNEDMKRHGIT